MTGSALPDTVLVQMPDGESVPYTLQEHADKSVSVHGPCPACFMRERTRAIPLTQALAVTRVEFKSLKHGTRVDAVGRLSVNEGVRLIHVGCFSGVIWRGVWVPDEGFRRMGRRRWS